MQSNQPNESVDAPAAAPVNAWILALIEVGNRRGRNWAITVVWLLVLLIGWVDYITGTRVSLGFVYFIPVVLSALWLGQRTGYLVSIASIVSRVGGDWLYGGDVSTPASIFWNRLTYLMLYVSFVGLLHALISLQRQLELRVRQRTAALAKALEVRDDLQRQLFNTSNRERSSIGHELHDGLGQHLMATSLAAKIHFENLQSDSHPAASDAGQILRMTLDGIRQTRQLARGLLLAAVEPDELVAELEELCSNLELEHGVACRFSCHGKISGLDATRASHLFYIAQEAVRNALRHSRASRIEIQLNQGPGSLELVVTDDGIGPPPPEAKSTGMGLKIMAHRSELIGGRFDIAPAAGAGARVRCQVALATDGPHV